MTINDFLCYYTGSKRYVVLCNVAFGTFHIFPLDITENDDFKETFGQLDILNWLEKDKTNYLVIAYVDQEKY